MLFFAFVRIVLIEDFLQSIQKILGALPSHYQSRNRDMFSRHFRSRSCFCSAWNLRDALSKIDHNFGPIGIHGDGKLIGIHLHINTSGHRKNKAYWVLCQEGSGEVAETYLATEAAVAAGVGETKYVFVSEIGLLNEIVKGKFNL